MTKIAQTDAAAALAAQEEMEQRLEDVKHRLEVLFGALTPTDSRLISDHQGVLLRDCLNDIMEAQDLCRDAWASAKAAAPQNTEHHESSEPLLRRVV